MIFLVSTYQYVASAFVFSRGPPFREPIYKNSTCWLMLWNRTMVVMPLNENVGGTLFLTVCLFVFCQRLARLFWTIRDNNFIFGMNTQLMKSFQIIPRSMNLWPLVCFIIILSLIVYLAGKLFSSCVPVLICHEILVCNAFWTLQRTSFNHFMCLHDMLAISYLVILYVVKCRGRAHTML